MSDAARRCTAVWRRLVEDRMRKLFLVVPVAAVVITALVAYRYLRPSAPPPSEAAIAAAVRPAPLMQLNDEHMRPVRLASYLGRHKLLVAFFDGDREGGAGALVETLREQHPEIASTG